jgi:hypothetical protein
MKQALIDTLEWYAEASPQQRLEDGGERASNLLMRLHEGDQAAENGEGDMLTVLLERVGTVIEHAKVETDAMSNLRASAMEWQD